MWEMKEDKSYACKEAREELLEVYALFQCEILGKIFYPDLK